MMLARARSARSSVDGYVALVGSALEKARRRPVPDVPRPGPVGDDAPDHDERPNSGEEEPSPTTPPPSARQSRTERERAWRLELHPDVRDALMAGRIITEQADLLTSNDLSSDDVRRLLTGALSQTTDETREAVREAVRSKYEGTPEDRLKRQRRQRRGSCGVDDDGMVWFHARLDPVTGTPIKEEFDRCENRLFHQDQRDNDRWNRRTAGQRGADIVAELLANGTLQRSTSAPSPGPMASPTERRRPSGPGTRSEPSGRVRRPSRARSDAAGSAKAPAEPCSCSQHPPTRPSLDLIADLDILGSAAADAVAYTSNGIAVPAELARASLCYADIQLWFTNHTRTELFLGTDVDLATPRIRQALLIRDGTCRWRGCSVEASRCEAHHLTFRRDGGATDVTNFALLCPRHHTYLHNIGAHLRMGADADQWKLIDDHTKQVIDEWAKPTPRTSNSAGQARPPNRTVDDKAA